VVASPRPPSWAIGHTEFNAGVLGETALPRRAGEKVRMWEGGVGVLGNWIWDFGFLIFPRSCGTRLRVD